MRITVRQHVQIRSGAGHRRGAAETRRAGRLVPLLLLILIGIAGAISAARTALAQGLRVTDLFPVPTNTVKLDWDAVSGVTITALWRDSGAIASVGAPGSFLDTTFSLNTRHAYRLKGTQTVYDPVTGQYSSVAWQSAPIYVTVRKVEVSQNGSVDARLDLRFGGIVYVDYKFNAPSINSTYRGGLYAGFNSDGAKVGRSYLKLPLLGPIEAGEGLWNVGGLFAYFTRAARTGSVSVVCRTAASDAWDPATLVWTNAPAPATSGSAAVSLSHDSASPNPRYVRLNALKEIESRALTGQTLSLVLMSGSETGTGWAYFAKKEYHEGAATYPAFALYAFGGPGVP